MSTPTPATLFDKLVDPWPMLLGVVAAFLGCCLGGYLVSRQNHIDKFERFHRFLSPETLYYPTVSQVRQLARSRLDPKKIIVVVGGSSVLHGTGQRVNQLWSDRLQDILGDQYQVFNLGQRCCYTAEFGAVAAEFLARDFPKVILLTDLKPGSMHADPDGYKYKYFFWDAYYKGLLLRDADREQRLRELIPEVERLVETQGKEAVQQGHVLAEAQRELRTEMCLDRALRFHDLWNTAAYTRFHTVWTAASRGAFTSARCGYPDDDPGATPLPARYPPQSHEWCMTWLGNFLKDKCVRDATGQWVEAPQSEDWAALRRAAQCSFPAPVRGRTLLLVLWCSSHYVKQLTAEEQECLAATSRFTLRHLESLGFAALEIGRAFPEEYYTDLLHLTDLGGYYMALAAAPKVRDMAQRLGYLKQGDKR